ncbi:MAG TPA: hypothetical protein VHI71_02990 [Actinomycetota bacterium]|nr:hypothetical protein [Actinomycetota bacterium]
MRKCVRIVLLLAVVGGVLSANQAQAGGDPSLELTEFTVDEKALCELRDQWIDDLLKTHEHGTWAPIEVELTDEQLEAVGLPPADVLRKGDYSSPTLVTKDGRYVDVPLEELEAEMQSSMTDDATAATYGGTGCLGIRPGALLLSVTSNSIGWCTLAHAYGSPGAYDISTAGHCGKNGDTATVIAGMGNRGGAAGIVLLDFGRYSRSTGDGGLGRDWALIDVDPAFQSLVTPTMCFWGGPRGRFDSSGDTATVTFGGNNLLDPEVTVNPNPALVQTIVHYGHGTGIGAGGTPRVGEAIAWRQNHFMFTGAINLGDSGSGANTLLGDAVGDNMEAAGIITHIWVDPLMRDGIGIMGGTRATLVGTPATGQIVPWPAPVPGLP